MSAKIIHSVLACGSALLCSGLLLSGSAKAGAAPQKTGAAPQKAGAAPARVRLAEDTPAAVATARRLGRLTGAAPVTAVMTFPLRRSEELTDLLSRLQDPVDPLYGQYLTPAEFTARFSPTQRDYDAAARYAKAEGLTVTGTQPNRLLLEISGPAARMEAAFGVRLTRYQSADGRIFHAPDAAPSVPRALSGILSGVAGLSNAALRRPHSIRRLDTVIRRAAAQGARTAGSGPDGGLAPQDIKTAYGLGASTLTGSGQTLALFELDGYTASDIAAYEAQFGLPSVPLQNVLLNTATGTAGTDADEVTLDIELQLALAPGASKLIVYETGGTDAQVLACYSRIASDNLAKQVSTSWGLDEQENTSSLIQSENTIFQQMAAQGQTIYAAAGDSGAYDSGTRRDGLRVDDPASQPYVCGVGGTTLTTAAPGGAYASETVWNSGTVQSGAGGGGVSSVWPIPSWQQAANPSAAGGSTTMRNVPDVSLNADPNTGYAVYYTGKWYVYGGTSCAAPLWSGFTALVNQQRTANGLAPMGQASPVLYPLLSGSRYASDFHDIANGSTNLYYSAVTGYDDASGLGTPLGAGLIADLGGAPAAVSALTTHVLWDNASGAASLWNYSPVSGGSTQNTYGPYAGWTAKAAAGGGTDGLTRLLWVKTDGTMSLWSLNNVTASFSQFSFGPYAGWTAQALSVGSGNTTHVLWDNASGAASLWNYSATAGTFTQNTYGPYPGWAATALADGPDGLTRLLWVKTDGTASVWNLNNSSGSFTQFTFGPYAGWTAHAVSVAPNNTTHVLWSNTSGAASIWNYSASSGTFTQNTYGPYAGWTATGVSDGADGKLRVLWNNTSGAASLWNLDNAAGTFSQFTFGPYSGWTAAGISGY